MDCKQYLDNHYLRRADWHCNRNHHQYGQKETQGKVNGLQLRKLRLLPNVRLMS